MRIGIIGLPRNGKTTVFNALTRGAAASGSFGGSRSANIGVAHVPDERLDRLTGIFKPKRTVPAEVTYVDLPSVHTAGQADAGADLFRGEVLGQLQRVDALLHVVRAFEDPSVPHVLGAIGHRRDIEKVNFDVLFADISLLDRRIERIKDGIKGMKAQERVQAEKNIEVLRTLQQQMENGVAARDRTFTVEELGAISDTFLLSKLPLLVALNVGEADLGRADELERELVELLPGERSGGAVLCGKLEEELAQMSLEEETEMRSGLGAGESGLRRMIRLSYQVLGLISFLTVGEDEVRAWTIEVATSASRAAGIVHSDIERGFIRAETVGYDDFIAAGSIAQARTNGTLRQEGREYVVQDGDIINFLFSV
jgi:GTP-binding protein YchF